MEQMDKKTTKVLSIFAIVMIVLMMIVAITIDIKSKEDREYYKIEQETSKTIRDAYEDVQRIKRGY